MRQQTEIEGLLARQDPAQVLAWAAKRAASLKTEMERLEVFTDVFRDYIAEQKQGRVVSAKPRAPRAAKEPRARQRRVRNPSMWAAASAARRYIEAAQTPLPLKVMLNHFHADGVRFSGQDEGESLSLLLRQTPKAVVLLPDHGYWLTNMPWRPAAYMNADVETAAVSPESTPPAVVEADEEPEPEEEDDGTVQGYLGQLPAPLPAGKAVAVAKPMLPVVANPQPMRLFDFSNHYIALDDNCLCGMCQDWRHRRDKMNALFPASDGHERSCRCDACSDFRQAHQAFLDISNRRDLWTEISYHAATNKHLMPYAEQIRTALEDVLSSEKTKGSWWAIRGGQFSIGHWMGVIQNAVTGVAIALRAAASGEIRYVQQEQRCVA